MGKLETFDEWFAIQNPKWLKDNHWVRRPWGWRDELWHDIVLHSHLANYQTCPKCGAIGTYHALFQPLYSYKRYWMCKYCGYGRNRYGEYQHWPHKAGHWGQWSGDDSKPTPKEVVERLTGCDPWVNTRVRP